MPERIQRRRTKGWRMPAGAVSVCRPGPWGNPWVVVQQPDTGSWYVVRHKAKPGRDPFAHTRWHRTYTEAARRAVAYYRRWLALSRRDVSPLRGKDLACYCYTSWPCHADVLLELAND